MTTRSQPNAHETAKLLFQLTLSLENCLRAGDFEQASGLFSERQKLIDLLQGADLDASTLALLEDVRQVELRTESCLRDLKTAASNELATAQRGRAASLAYAKHSQA